MKKIYDCLVIGGGPSGLAAGEVLARSKQDFLIIEKGKLLYKRDSRKPVDVVTGVGGGGLYSDGKLSFYPSGSNLYHLNSDYLSKSYSLFEKTLSNIDVDVPKFDIKWLQDNEQYLVNDVITKKPYDSVVLSQEQLYHLGFSMYDQIGKNHFLTNSEVTSITVSAGIYSVRIKDLIDGQTKNFQSKNILYCAGKFGSLKLRSLFPNTNLIFKKFEVGIRLETDPDGFDFNDEKQTDLKLIIPTKKDSIEFRTFCFCRNGYVIHGQFENFNTYNGVSNKSAFTKTNFGINLRIKREATFLEMEDDLRSLQEFDSLVDLPLPTFLNAKPKHWNEDIYELFKRCIIQTFPKLSRTSATVTGPSFEYFGYYPALDMELKVDNQNLWVCGDATGDFRGLTPSLISGYIAALSLVNKEKRDKDFSYRTIRLKASSIKRTKTVFTAQSKKFFYCKDAICEYVFKENCVPVNPFQAFGYFLNDRVYRDLIRNGNNEMISRCDELWIFGPIADGVLFEIARADELKMPIRFFNIATYAAEIREIHNLSDLIFEPEVHSRIPRENLINFIGKNYDTKPEINQLKLNLGENNG